MFRWRLFLLLLTAGMLLGTVSAQAQRFDYRRDYTRLLERSRKTSDSLSYDRLLPRFLQHDPKLTVYGMLCLMIGYTGRPEYRPYETLATEKLVLQRNNDTQYREVIAIADTFLARHPLNQQVILEKAFAFHQLGQHDSAAFYKAQFGRIMAAMDWSGDGHTPDHAMFAIGPRDGRNFIDKYYHADLGRSGNAEDSEGNFCDMLEIKFRKEGKEQRMVFYFVIQHAVNTTARKPELLPGDKP